LKSKDETFGTFRQFKAKIESEIRNKIRILRIDRGGKYMSHDFLNYCKQNGINRELSQAKTPQQNGVAKKRNQTILDRARSLAVESKLPSYLWTEAVNTTNYIVNISPTSANSGMTPQEKYSSKVPTVNHLKVFGSIAFVHIPKTSKNKMETKTMKCLFLGYDNDLKTYRLYDYIKRRIMLSHDVTIDVNKSGISPPCSTT
jgi:hypothetical protein